MKIDFVKTLEASAPYIPGRIYFEESTSLIKVATASNQYRVFGGVRSADYDSSTDILTIQNGNGDEIYIDFSQYVKQDEYEDDQYVVSVALNELNGKIDEVQSAVQSVYDNIPEILYNYTNNFFDYVEYNSTDKTIDFYNDNAGKLQSIDATDFIKDGMVNDVSIHNGTGANANVSCLVVTFNTDASTEAIEIPVTKIFDPSLIPTDASVSAWGYTKNALTGINFNGVDASVTNGVATVVGTYLPVFTTGDSTYDAGSNRIISTGISKGTSSIILNLDGEYNRVMVSDSTAQYSQLFSNELSLRNSSYVSTAYCIDHISREAGSGIENNYTYLFPDSSGTLALTLNIPTDASIAAWGYTKNALTGVNFNGVDASVTNGVASILPIFDSEPTEDSSNFITSGAVYSTIADTEEVFAAAINDIQTNLSSMSQEMDTVYDEIYSISNQMYGTLRNFQINGVTQQNIGNNADTVNFILDDVPTQDASYHGVSSAGLYNVITQNERVVAEVMNDLNDRLLAVEGIDVVDSSTVSSWGFTKNALTGVSFNGVDASVTNGVAGITATIPPDDVFVIPVTKSGTTYSTTVTKAEASAALYADKLLFVWYNRTVMPLVKYYSDDYGEYVFYAVSKYYIYTMTLVASPGDGPFTCSYSETAIPATVTDSTVGGWGYIKSYTETDPIFSASAAAGITSTDITNWNNKVSNVQSDWNATTGLSAILNKPTIPSTLDQIADGSTRKLSNYLPLAGGTMNVDASINILTALGNQGLSINSMGMEVYGPNDYSYIGQNMVTVTSQYDGVTELRPEALYVLSVSGANDYIGTWYNDGSICRKISSNTSYTYTFPNKTGTLAVTSDIPAAITESDVSDWGFTKNTGTYSKPSGGIPASDLTTAVQTSLSKADTALQSFTETDPVFSASAAAGITSSDITNWNSKTSNIGNAKIFYGTCSTTGATAAKIVDCSTFTSADLVNGALIFVTFSETNSATPATLTMDVNSTGAKSIKKQYKAASVTSLTAGGELRDNVTYLFTYNGSSWVCMTLDYNSTYSTIDAESAIAGTGTVAGLVSSSVLKTAITTHAPAAITESDVTGWGFTKNTGTLTGVKFNNVSATINGTVAEITATIPPEVTESTVSGWGFTKNTGTLTSHADHKLLIGSASATAASSNTITYVESLTGTATATHGDLTVTPTLKTITIPSAVTESTVSGWGFTKNTGTLTEHATHKLTATNNNATSTSGTITFVESLTGTNTATSGDLTITATRKSVTIPSAPGTLKTNNTSAQTASASEALSGTINLHKVAKTGTYSDLIGTPTIPTVNNATLTIQKNGTTVNTFTANSSSNVTANIQVNELPAVTSSDNGKILEVVNGAWAAASPITVYSGSNEPNNSTGKNGDIYIQS